MSPVIQLGFLLLCSFVVDSCSASHELHLKNKTENELLIRNDSSPHKREDVNKKGIIRCLACRKLVKKVMPSISKKLYQKLCSTCHVFIDYHLESCLKRVGKLHKSVMDFWFPNRRPLEACRKINMCKK